MLGSLDELYAFVRRGDYEIYITEEERAELKGVPPNWAGSEYFIKPDLIRNHGFCYPLIHDIRGLYKLYGTHGAETDKKIDSVINYISNDDFHNKISKGYGILITDKRIYHGMGWDPKYPGWFDVTHYINNSIDRSAPNGSHTENQPCYIPKLLFFAMNIVNYPTALKTRWFADLLDCLDKYKTENDTYKFPKEWLPEKQGYAVGGFHMSFGENRRKKNWCEIESTFYMQLLKQNT